jgi:hypothetical protein
MYPSFRSTFEGNLPKEPRLSNNSTPNLVADLAGPLRELWLSHGPSNENSWEIPPSLESRGTNVFLVQMDFLLRVLSTGALWILDEIDQSLHPDLCVAILHLFTHPEVNKTKAQRHNFFSLLIVGNCSPTYALTKSSL